MQEILSDLPVKQDINSIGEMPFQTQRKGTSSSLRHYTDSEGTGHAVSPSLLHLAAHTFFNSHIFPTSLLSS